MRNCSLRQISPFATGFSTLLENFSPFSTNLKLSSANSFCSLRAISPFPEVFSTLLENFPPFSTNLNLSFANSISLGESKTWRLGKDRTSHRVLHKVEPKVNFILRKFRTIFVSHNNPCFPCNIAITNFLTLYTCEINLLAELSFVTLTIHLCNGLNDKNLVKPRKTCFLTI